MAGRKRTGQGSKEVASKQVLALEKHTAKLKADNDRLLQEISECNQHTHAQRARIRYLEHIQHVIQAMGKSTDPEHWLANCVSAIRDVFQADRAWLLSPCAPDADHYHVPVEVTASAWPGAHASDTRLPMDDDARRIMQQALNAPGPVVCRQMDAKGIVEKFSIRSQMFMAIRPAIGKPWMLGLHQCAHEGEWTAEEQQLFNDIGAKIEQLLGHVRLHKDLKDREKRLRLLLDSTEEGIYGIDANGICTFANPASVKLLGYTDAAELIGKNMRELTGFSCPGICPDLSDGCSDCQVHQEGRGISWEGGDFQSASGASFPVEFHCNPIRHGDHIDGATITFVNISERKQYERKIWHQANYDSLTGLPGRTLFMDRLIQATHAAHREGHSVALMYIDLDRFKWVNDTLGHGAGDQLLMEAAQRLKACARKSDTVARLGGDEFVVILPSISTARSAEQVAEKILASLALPYRLSDRNESFVSGTIGIALYPDDAADADTLLKNADMAMYRAKDDGRNTFAFFTDEMNQAVLEHMRVEQELHHALDNNELELHYQPLIDLRSGAVVGAEALLRWHHPQRGLVYPRDFIPLAEETGLILAIDDWVLRDAVKQLGDWRERGLPVLKTSINTSARQCVDAGFVTRLNKILDRSRFPASKLGLAMDITESLMLEHVDEVVARLEKIRGLGVSLTVDDFGTGYTSLIELKRFPVESIKIARAFVQNITSDPKDAGLTRAIISMSHNLGMRVIAEGIETIEQLNFLREAGCDLGHGHYFCKALPAKEFEAYLGAN